LESPPLFIQSPEGGGGVVSFDSHAWVEVERKGGGAATIREEGPIQRKRTRTYSGETHHWIDQSEGFIANHSFLVVTTRRREWVTETETDAECEGG
jgi:hypothetical protein